MITARFFEKSSYFNGQLKFFKYFSGFINEAKTYKNHPLTFGFGKYESLAEFCLSIAEWYKAESQNKPEFLQESCAKMKLALWEIMIQYPCDKRPGKDKMPLILRNLKRKYSCNLVLYFFKKLQELKAEGSLKGAKEHWANLIQTMNHEELKSNFLQNLDNELENVDWEGTWILDLDDM